MKLAYYITPHGFGHAVRSLEVIRHLRAMRRDLEITLVSDLPEFLVTQNAGPVPTRKRVLDVGLKQLDSVRYDLGATLAAIGELRAGQERIQGEEKDFLERNRIGGIVCDVPFLPLRPANEVGIPAVCLGNFTWDWIYRSFAGNDPRWTELADWITGEYGFADSFLRLPFHGGGDCFQMVEDVPMIARRAVHGRDEIRNMLGIGDGVKACLLGFKDLNLPPESLSRIATIPDTVFLFKKPLKYTFTNGLCVDSLDVPYMDFVAAVDGVITKPGYGIVTDCIANDAPMIYCDRGEFPEYPILVEAIEKYLTSVFMPSSELYAGNWKPYLERLESARPEYEKGSARAKGSVPRPPVNGAEVCARRILDFMDRGQ